MGENINFKSVFDAYDRKFDEIAAADKKAKEAGVLVGRYYKEQIADGYAFYLITKENKTRCKLEVVTGIGDDWVIPRFGESAWVGRKEVVWNIDRRDALVEIFSKTGLN